MRDGLGLLPLQPVLCCCCSATALLLSLRLAAALFCGCCSFCGHWRSPPHGKGRSGIKCAFPPRAPPGSAVPTVEPGAGSGVHDMLLLLQQFCRCSYLYVAALLFCSARTAAAISTMCLLLTPVNMNIISCQPLSMKCLLFLKIKDGSIRLGSCTSTVSQLAFICRPGGGLLPASFWRSYVRVRHAAACCCWKGAGTLR